MATTDSFAQLNRFTDSAKDRFALQVTLARQAHLTAMGCSRCLPEPGGLLGAHRPKMISKTITVTDLGHRR